MAGYNRINTNASVLIQKGTTALNKIVVGKTGSTDWTVTVYDGVDANGKVVTANAANNGGNYDYECTLTQGLYVVTAGTTPGDITIVYE